MRPSGRRAVIGVLQAVALLALSLDTASAATQAAPAVPVPSAAARAAEVTSGTPTWSAVTVPLPTGGVNSQLFAESCPKAWFCVAVGQYYYSGGLGGLIETFSGGVMTAAVAPLPSGVTTNTVRLTAVTCVSSQSCVAAGQFFDSAGYGYLFFDTFSGRTWTGVQAPLPSDASNFGPSLVAIACPAPGSCFAAGSYTTGSTYPGTPNGLIEALSGGSWTATAVPLPNGGSFGDLENLTCPTVSDCVAAGVYGDGSSGQLGLIETLASGTWTATAAPFVAGGASYPGGSSVGLACPQAGTCVASGFQNVDDASPWQGLFDVLSGGNWSSVPEPTPSGDQDPWVPAVTCPRPGSCVAVGTDSSATIQPSGPLIETLSGGTWTATQAPVPVNGTSTGSLEAVACAAAGACVATGQYRDSSDAVHPLIESLTAGTWTSTEGPVPPGASVTTVSLGPVSCPTAASCVATGFYTTSGNQGQSFFDVESSTSVAVTSSANAAVTSQAVTYSGSVNPSVATGTMTFKDNGKAIAACGAVTVANGSASCTTSYPTKGDHSITAVYAGSKTFAPSTSGALTELVMWPAYVGQVLKDHPDVYYRLDDAGGTVAYDTSGHGNNGLYTSFDYQGTE